MIFLSALSGCGPDPEFVQRQDVWLSEASSFFQDQKSLSDVHPWLRKQNVIYTFDNRDVVDGSWNVTLEKLYLYSFRCEWKDIRLYITVDDAGIVTAHSVSSDGPCLW